MKKILLVLIMAFTVLTSYAFDAVVDGIYYDLNSETKEASVAFDIEKDPFEDTDRYKGAITIPSTIIWNGVTYSVTSIGDVAFGGCSNLTSVVIPNSVTSIGEGAFDSCTGLTTVNIPNSVTSIGVYAFFGCESLTSVVIPNSVKSIGDYAFQWCVSLTSVVIPNSVTSIGEDVFKDCTSLPVENGIRYAGTYLVGVEGDAQSSYSIKEGTMFIGDNVFLDCTNLTSVVIPNSVLNIGKKAFTDCNALASPLYNATFFVKMPLSQSGSYAVTDGIKTICNNAFSGCKQITSIFLPNSVDSIASSAFRGCI